MSALTVIKNDFSIANVQKGTALVIGNFEGVHKGHQALLEKLVQTAQVKNLIPCVYTFYPHPKKFFGRPDAPKRLMNLGQKITKLHKYGAEIVVTKPFNAKLAGMGFGEYVNHLVDDLNVKHIIVGEDFAFGKNREGTAEKLLSLGKEKGFSVEIVHDVVCNKQSERYSSTLIRQHLKEGEVKQAGHMLGAPVTFKTFLYEDDFCNLVAHLKGYSPIKKGVYFAKIRYSDESVENEGGIVPLQIAGNKAYIKPLPEMPDLIEGRIYLSLVDRIETIENIENT